MKKRHIKTLQEKYGFQSVLKECEKIIDSSKRGMDNLTLDDIPHIGIAYLDWDDRKADNDLIYCFEDFSIYGTSLIKLKILQVTEHDFTIAHYDDHHHSLCIMTASTEDYIVEGNQIKSKKYHIDEKQNQPQ